MFDFVMASGVHCEKQWCTEANPVDVHQDDDRVGARDGQEKAEKNGLVILEK